MIKGLDSFKSFFKGFEDSYTIIGGTACYLIMESMDLDFRATKDIDLVIILESLSPDFGKRLWEYVEEAGYGHRNNNTGKLPFYRFSKPKSEDYPSMIELFSKQSGSLILPDHATITPVSFDDNISSLSAILLEEEYYEFLKQGRKMINGLTILDTPYIIPFKMKAWLDLTSRKEKGEHIDEKDIKKHKNDVFRLSQVLSTDVKIQISGEIKNDVISFINAMNTENVDLKQLRIRVSKEEILNRLSACYDI